jgi:hypothetical protein
MTEKVPLSKLMEDKSFLELRLRKHRTWKHRTSGNNYGINCIYYNESDMFFYVGYTPQEFYIGHDEGPLFGRPLDEFLEKFAPMKDKTIQVEVEDFLLDFKP